MVEESAERLHPDVPHRDVRDPATLRALAHPVRVRLLEALIQHSPATATELADRIGETQANCSWHLRQLHRYGFVEEVEGKGRQRPWQLVRQTFSLDLWGADEPDSPYALASDAMWDVLLDREVDAIRNWRTAKFHDAPEWRQATSEWQTWAWLTADELTTFTSELAELAERHLIARIDRVDPAKRPPGCRPLRFVAWTTPSGPDTETPASTEPPANTEPPASTEPTEPRTP
jgi:DNA-binding transcriptional ArsR family regulator